MIQRWTRGELKCAIAALILLPILSLCEAGLNEMREPKEAQESHPFDKLPPDEYMMEYVGSILLGGFRAIAVDFLWLRVDRLQKDKKWDEVRLVCEAIVRLQPHMSEVYAHLGWNMAYNISNLFESPDDKVKWIRAGLEYIDNGRVRNPRDERMEFWLGYIYWHRVPRNEHTLAPLSEQLVLQIIERQDGACCYETAIQHLGKAQRLYDEAMGAAAVYTDKYEGLIVDAKFHQAYHKMGDCWSRPGIGDDPKRWDDVQAQLDETCHYIRYVDNRYDPGTTFWNDRLLYIYHLKRILEIERDAERIGKEEGLEAELPALWAIVDGYKTLKSGKSLFRQGALERRLRGAMLRVCEASYARLDHGDLAGAQALWDQMIVSDKNRHGENDPYRDAWTAWGQGMSQLAEALPIEQQAHRAAQAGRADEAAAAAAQALQMYLKTIDDFGLMDMSVFQNRVAILRKLAGK